MRMGAGRFAVLLMLGVTVYDEAALCSREPPPYAGCLGLWMEPSLSSRI